MTLAILASPIMLLILAGITVMLGGAFMRGAERIVPAFTIIALCSAFVLAWQLWPMTTLGRMSVFIFDRISILGEMLAIFSAAFAAMLSISYFKGRGGVRFEYYALIIFSAVGMSIAVSSADLIMLLIGLETLSITGYVLVGYPGGSRSSTEASLKFFMMGLFASAFFVMGVAFLFGATGSTDIGLIAERAFDVALGDGRSFLFFGVAMIAIGFALKVALIPFHAWLPDAYEGAPLPVIAHISVGFFVVGFITFARFSLAVAGSMGAIWHGLFWILSAITMIGGSLAALRQDDLKRMLAYTTITHAGYFLMIFPTLVVGGTLPMKGLIYALIAYSIGMVGALSVIWALKGRWDSLLDVGRLSGLAKRRPIIAVSFTLFMMSLMGLPPTVGFFGRYYLFMVAIKRGEIALVAIGIIASLVLLCTFMRVVMAIYLKDVQVEERSPLDPMNLGIISISTMAVLTFGIFPEKLIAFINACAM